MGDCCLTPYSILVLMLHCHSQAATTGGVSTSSSPMPTSSSSLSSSPATSWFAVSRASICSVSNLSSLSETCTTPAKTCQTQLSPHRDNPVPPPLPHIYQQKKLLLRCNLYQRLGSQQHASKAHVSRGCQKTLRLQSMQSVQRSQATHHTGLILHNHAPLPDSNGLAAGCACLLEHLNALCLLEGLQHTEGVSAKSSPTS